MSTGALEADGNVRAARWLTYLMFFMFAMTTDSVGVIIPQVVKQFHLSLTAASALHYGNMIALALAGLCLGVLADRYGRKFAILCGLLLFIAVAFVFPLAGSFAAILAMVVVSGTAIGVFKTGALGLIGDISKNSAQHTTTLNLAEGFFGVGAIIGPLIVAELARRGVNWQWLYVAAGVLCVALLAIALTVRYPDRSSERTRGPSRESSAMLLQDPYAMGFSVAVFTYVAVECAIYVWMPTLLAEYEGPLRAFVPYALSTFFLLRAAGRFLGIFLLRRLRWATVLAICSLAIFSCFFASLWGGVQAALVSLPAAGLFMSMVYPTLNSKGLGCFPPDDHGRVAGFILFFTCLGAALGPLAMGAVSDVFGGARYGFVLATGLAGLLAAALVGNALFDPARHRLESVNVPNASIA